MFSHLLVSGWNKTDTPQDNNKWNSVDIIHFSSPRGFSSKKMPTSSRVNLHLR